MKNKKAIFLIMVLLVITTFVLLHFNNTSSPSIVSNFEGFLYQYENFDEELPVHFTEECNKYKDETVTIDKDQAREDIANLFSLLKFGYAGYSYFGGDPVFHRARDNMLKEIDNLESESISKELLTEIILPDLDFIQDSHFAIDNYKVCKYTKYYSSKDYIFYKDFKGYYTYIDDEIYYLESINNGQV